MRRARIKGAQRSTKGRQSRKLARAARMKADKADKADRSASRAKPHAGRAKSEKANTGVRTWIGSWTTADRFIHS